MDNSEVYCIKKGYIQILEGLAKKSIQMVLLITILKYNLKTMTVTYYLVIFHKVKSKLAKTLCIWFMMYGSWEIMSKVMGQGVRAIMVKY